MTSMGRSMDAFSEDKLLLGWDRMSMEAFTEDKLMLGWARMLQTYGLNFGNVLTYVLIISFEVLISFGIVSESGRHLFATFRKCL
jgi:hypothetical protein